MTRHVDAETIAILAWWFASVGALLLMNHKGRAR